MTGYSEKDMYKVTDLWQSFHGRKHVATIQTILPDEVYTLRIIESEYSDKIKNITSTMFKHGFMDGNEYKALLNALSCMWDIYVTNGWEVRIYVK